MSKKETAYKVTGLKRVFLYFVLGSVLVGASAFLSYSITANHYKNAVQNAVAAENAMREKENLSVDSANKQTGNNKALYSALTPPHMVWVTASGKKFHSNQYCSYMENPVMIPLGTATSEGYTMCSKCWRLK